MGMGMGMHQNMTAVYAALNETNPTPDSYYNHPEYATWMYAHILLMIVAWIIVLPLGKPPGPGPPSSHMLTISYSRLR